MRTSMTIAGLLALLTALALPPGPVQAAHSSTAQNTRAKVRKPPADKGPAETRAERDRRLQRECRGKPNAGACEGYGN